MKLADLFLNRFLYKDNEQNLETKDSVYNAGNAIDADVPPLASGGAAQDINTSNVTINGNQLTPGTIPQATLDVSNWGWGQTCAFTSASATQVNWGAGTFKSASGITYNIIAGNTGNMSAKNYIYLDLNVSATAYQVTTTPATAVGIGKVLVAVAQNGATAATYNLSEASQIVGDNILANTINASKLTVGQLSAITADLGTVTAGAITGVTITGGTIRTAVTGQRVEIKGTDNNVAFYDSAGTLQGQIFGMTTGSGVLWVNGINGIGLAIGSTNVFSLSSTSVACWQPFYPSANNSKDIGIPGLVWRDIYNRDVWSRDLHATRDIEGVDVYGTIHPDNGIDALITVGSDNYLFSEGILTLQF